MKPYYTVKEDGFQAYWLEGSTHKEKAIIWMHGSGMNEKHCMEDAAYAEMKEIYETKISDARWMAYDIPGNIGWILYFIGIVLCFTNQSQWPESPLMMALLMIAVIPAVLMLIGIVELISERIAKLDRVLPKIRLLRGFGALTLGGILGTVVPLIAAAANALTVDADGKVLIIMSVGGLLCAVFAGLLYKGYHKAAY